MKIAEKFNAFSEYAVKSFNIEPSNVMMIKWSGGFPMTSQVIYYTKTY